MVRYERIVNNVPTTLNGGISAGTSSITVTDGSVYPTEGDFRIQIEDEVMRVTARATNVLTVVRGVEGTTGAIHADGKQVNAGITAEGLSTYIDHILGAPSARPPARLQDINGDLLTSSDFTWDNQGSATVTDDVDGGISIVSATTTGTGWNLLHKPTPSAAPWKVTAGFMMGPGWEWSIASGSLGGMFARENSTTRMLILSVEAQDLWHASRYSSPTAFSAFISGAKDPQAQNEWWWMQVEDNNTNVILRGSYDGVNFFEIGSEGRTAYLTGGADKVGFALMERGFIALKQLHLKSWTEE